MRKEGCECTGRLDARVEPRLVASFAAVSFPRFAPANLDGVDTIHGSVTSRGRLGERSHERDGTIPSVCGFFLSRSFLGCSSSSSMSDKAFGRAEADGGRGKPHELDKRRIGNFRFALLLRLRAHRFHPVLRFIRPPVQDQRFSLPLVDAFVWVGRETKEKAYLPEGETKRWTVLFDERACRFHGCHRRFPTDARFNAPFETALPWET